MKENDPVTAYFDKLPETHKRQFEERASGANFNFQQRLTLACELGGASSGRLLDCAAGTGEITCALLKSGRFNHATVVDVSPAMLQSAKDLLTSQIKNTELEFVHSDVFNFKPSASRFDLILCLGLIAHTGRLDTLLPHLRSMLTSGGQIILQTTLADHFGTRVVRALTSRSELARRGYRISCSLNETSPMRATAPDCGFWRRGGTASVFRSAIAFGRGEIFNWKLGWKNGRAATEPTQFICSELDESRFFGQQHFPRGGRIVSKRARTCQGGSVHKCECAGVWDSRRTECCRSTGVAAAFCSDVSSTTSRVGLLKPARPRDAQRRSRCSVRPRIVEILLRWFATMASADGPPLCRSSARHVGTMGVAKRNVEKTSCCVSL